jgi:hypothetical protein
MKVVSLHRLVLILQADVQLCMFNLKPATTPNRLHTAAARARNFVHVQPRRGMER